MKRDVVLEYGVMITERQQLRTVDLHRTVTTSDAKVRCTARVKLPLIPEPGDLLMVPDGDPDGGSYSELITHVSLEPEAGVDATICLEDDENRGWTLKEWLDWNVGWKIAERLTI